MGADAEPLVPGVAAAVADSIRAAPVCSLTAVKALLALFLMFLLVVSGPFFEYVISPLGGGALEPSAWGHVLQGILLVIMYALLVHLIGMDIL